VRGLLEWGELSLLPNIELRLFWKLLKFEMDEVRVESL
jgi:hypothetical protein